MERWKDKFKMSIKQREKEKATIFKDVEFTDGIVNKNSKSESKPKIKNKANRPPSRESRPNLTNIDVKLYGNSNNVSLQSYFSVIIC